MSRADFSHIVKMRVAEKKQPPHGGRRLTIEDERWVEPRAQQERSNTLNWMASLKNLSARRMSFFRAYAVKDQYVVQGHNAFEVMYVGATYHWQEVQLTGTHAVQC